MLYNKTDIKFGKGDCIVGRGGMGTVFRAVLLPTGKEVAVKSILLDTESAEDIKLPRSSGAQAPVCNSPVSRSPLVVYNRDCSTAAVSGALQEVQCMIALQDSAGYKDIESEIQKLSSPWEPLVLSLCPTPSRAAFVALANTHGSAPSIYHDFTAPQQAETSTNTVTPARGVSTSVGFAEFPASRQAAASTNTLTPAHCVSSSVGFVHSRGSCSAEGTSLHSNTAQNAPGISSVKFKPIIGSYAHSRRHPNIVEFLGAYLCQGDTIIFLG